MRRIWMQKQLMNVHAVPRLDEALQHVTLPPAGEAIRVADLGCSSGPNCVQYTAHIVQALRSRLSDTREVVAFFNDLPSNDFNTLFKHLSREITQAASSLQVPAVLYEPTSPAFNGDHLYIDDAPAAVRRLVEKQAAVDLAAFLHARAAELAPGGLLFFLAKGNGYSGNGPRRHLREDDAFDVGLIAMATTWNDLRSKELLTKEHTAACNFPIYYRCLDDMKKGLESCSSEFHSHRMDMIKSPVFAHAVKNGHRAGVCKVVSRFS